MKASSNMCEALLSIAGQSEAWHEWLKSRGESHVSGELQRALLRVMVKVPFISLIALLTFVHPRKKNTTNPLLLQYLESRIFFFTSFRPN